jgi:iron complex outermembrane receptor protein
LQQGDIAPGSANLVSANLVNANQALVPYRSKEWEIGFKTATRTIDVTTALFRLQRPFANTVALNATQNIFEITGQQVNYGAEISAQGTLLHRLLVDGGFTALNARLNDTGIAATNGKRFVGIPGYKSNFYSEYRVPGVAHLSVTAIGNSWAAVRRMTKTYTQPVATTSMIWASVARTWSSRSWRRCGSQPTT